ncbi:MAG TPA: phosphoribosylformylglycinamidine synthase [Candidatus Andersenbacteria bacterium]|nr:phosphoribosylformylglycinamidine synthase [Candidatus Andersenbacteria bacterium]
MIYYWIYRQVRSDLEFGFTIESKSALSELELAKLRWLIAETFEPNKTGNQPFFDQSEIVEIGPRLSIETPFSSNAVSICQSMGLRHITRIERTQRYLIENGQSSEILLKTCLDRMTEQHYPNGIENFDTGIIPEDVQAVDLMGRGKTALEEMNSTLGLGMDTRDLDYYQHLFTKVLRRNPTDVELFQLGNANSEHSRHWYFKGQIVIDGTPMQQTLFEIVQQPLKNLGSENCSLVAFRDNAGVIKGFGTCLILPVTPGKPSEMRVLEKVVHIACTAETHNHPTFVAPFPGANTGGGGRIRDNSAVGRGGIAGVGVAGYFVGNLFIPGYEIPGEVAGKDKPSKYASPLSILIEGSNGVSSYGNQFGEPLTLGFTRTFGQIVGNEWREPRKPILYSGGLSHLFDEHIAKETPEVGMLIVRIGGPAYPIGVGGGSASSMMQGQNTEVLDFNSVQRGNAEMENRANRVIRACAEMGDNNPISSIHDQGAGGPSNVLTELLEPLGGKISIRGIVLGDKTMSVLQIWSAEFQEGYGLLIRPEQIELFQSVCTRERVNCEVLGEIDGSGNVVVEDSQNGTTPVELNLEQILTNMPQKTFESTRRPMALVPLELPDVTVGEAIEKVFKLPHVGSKGFLVHKVDRSVTGLVAQQQCCGIAQIPIANVSVNAQSHFGFTGAASAVGEQPIKMLLDPKGGARMAVAEMLTNIASVKIRSLEDIRCRANWIWPAKMPHEGALLYDAAKAMSNLMIELGVNGLEIAQDGGKDSLTPVANVAGELVKSPGSLVILGYAPVPNITKKVTPDIKMPGESSLALIDLGHGKNRLGGSAFAQALNQLGDESPDVDDPKLLKNAFLAIQKMIDEDLILSLHDRSDGGLITAVAEMCMASRCGFNVIIPHGAEVLASLFGEELGFIMEIDAESEKRIFQICESFQVPISWIGVTRSDRVCNITAQDGRKLFQSTIMELRQWWEATSFELEKLQMNPECAEQEYCTHHVQLPRINVASSYRLPFIPQAGFAEVLESENKPRVAVLREEGTNGDREMAAAFFAAGCSPFDITMQDLMDGNATLDNFQGLVFPGGFSYMDVFDSAKGWAGTILFNEKLREMFDRFYAREDTFSLGVCNGCQLMALLGWVPWKGIEGEKQPRFVHNTSGRFESRWAQVEILPSPSILLTGMEGSKLGVWIAHGEGQLVYPDESIEQGVWERRLAPLAFIDPFGNPTEIYPHNPNGSPHGITALCSPNGRHLAMMPHPERCFTLWQWPWMPPEWEGIEASPWLRMFQNARTWCMDHRS